MGCQWVKSRRKAVSASWIQTTDFQIPMILLGVKQGHMESFSQPQTWLSKSHKRHHKMAKNNVKYYEICKIHPEPKFHPSGVLGSQYSPRLKAY